MAEKSPKRLKIEQALAEDPGDPFLRYGLAVQCLREGEIVEGRDLLHALIAERPDEVAACQQLGQSYMETEEHDEARKALTQGLARAKKVRDHHAQAEISGLLDQMEGHD